MKRYDEIEMGVWMLVDCKGMGVRMVLVGCTLHGREYGLDRAGLEMGVWMLVDCKGRD